MEQVVFKGMGQRIADFLLEQSALEGSDTINMTHETAAKNLGTAREVVSECSNTLRAKASFHYQGERS